MTTARDIITSSLRKIHVIGQGASLDANEANEALTTLNSMLSSFSAEGALIFQETKETFNLVGGQETYTIVSGGDFSTTAPVFISAAFVTQGETDYSLLQYDEQEYANITQKEIEGSIPRIYYYDSNFPTANIFLYPVPSPSTTFTMYSRKPLTTFTDLDASFEMPAQYEAMLIHNLAVWIAPEYEREASPTIQDIAGETKKTVMVQNRRNEKHVSNLTGIPARGTSSKYSERNILGGYFT